MFRALRAFYDDVVAPPVAEIVHVREQRWLRWEEPVQRITTRIVDLLPKVGRRDPVVLSIDTKRVEMVVLPTHRRLNVAVQHREFRIRPN